ALAVVIGSVTNVLTGHGGLPALLGAVASQYHQLQPSEPVIPRLGYASGLDLGTYRDLQRILGKYLRPGDWVFDFSNEPALYYYLLGYQPHTRYYHISMAIPEVAQKDVIAQLERDPPRLIVFDNALLGIPAWDYVENMVRHYDVSQYILDHYRPLLSTHTQLLLAPVSSDLSAAQASALPLSEPVVTDDLYFSASPCDWGYAPNFLAISPPAHQASVAPVSLQIGNRAATRSSMGWAVDQQARLPVRQVVAVVDGRVVETTTPSLLRPDVADYLGLPEVQKSGFFFPDLPSGFPRIFGVSESGVASELSYGPGANAPTDTSPLSQIQLPDGSAIPVRPEIVTGFVDTTTAAITTPIVAPAGTDWSRYRWLELTFPGNVQPDSWALSDTTGGAPRREIRFKTLSTSPRIFRLYVGNCLQWHGYAGDTLYINQVTAQDITRIRLLP
ncbi:MAG TPA: hypothetical protein VF221_08335, partial [Chloroflexota bacterium]